MEIDQNSWYRLTIPGNAQQSLSGASPRINSTTGLVGLSSSDNSTSSQQWQLFSVGSSKYMLRTKASGPSGFMTSNNENGTCESSKLQIQMGITANTSLLWMIRGRTDNMIELSHPVSGRECRVDTSESNGVHVTSNTTQLVLSRIDEINDLAFSTIGTLLANRTRTSSITTMATASSVYPRTFVLSTSSHPYTLPTALPTAFPFPPPVTQSQSRLSPSAAMGIGVAAGVIGFGILLTAALFIYRCWKIRRSPAVQNYRRARLWKGFAPATPTTARTTFIEAKMSNIYFAELPTPATPASTLSPPLDCHAISWPVLPITLRTPSSPPIELPV